MANPRQRRCIASLNLVTLPWAPSTRTSSVTNSTPVTIPIAGPSTVGSTVNVAKFGTYLQDVNALTSIAHGDNADLDVTLQSPAGTVVTLTTDNGYERNGVFNGTVWDDDANPGGQVPYSTNNGLATDHLYANGVVASPLVPEEAMGAFIGENPNGTWTLVVSDDLNGVGGSLNGWGLTFVTSSCPPRPDGRIRRGAGPQVGDNVYTATGAGQTRTGSATRGHDVTYFVSAQNDAQLPDTLVLQGGRSTHRFTVAYRSPGGANITNAVTAGTFTTPVLAPGATYTVKVVVTVRNTAPRGASLARTLTATSREDSRRQDTVRFITGRA